MTDSSSAFLQGQGLPINLARIDEELTRLWGPAAERVGGPELDHPTVTRVVLANLVVGGMPQEPDRFARAFETVVERFPCRAIILQTDSGDGGRRVRAEVSAVCHLPAPGLPQVCTERIVLTSGSGASDLLPGAVRPLLEPDIPIVLWWVGDPRADEALFRDLADESTRLILDMLEVGAPAEALRLGLDPSLSPSSRDAVWFRITPWRELIAQQFDAPGRAESLKKIRAVRVESVARIEGGVPRGSAWLIAWLAGQLGWEPVGESRHGEGSLSARFRDALGGEVETSISFRLDPSAPTSRIEAVTLTLDDDGPDRISLRRKAPGSTEVRVEVHCSTICPLPLTVMLDEVEPARRIASAMESDRSDPPAKRALPHLLRLLA